MSPQAMSPGGADAAGADAAGADAAGADAAGKDAAAAIALRRRSIEAEYYDRIRRRSPAELAADAAQRLDVALGRLLFATTTPALNHLLGRLRLRRARAARRLRAEGAPGFAGFAAQGFIHLPEGTFDASLVAAIAAAAAERMEDDRHSLPTGQNLARQERLFPGRVYARRLIDPREIPEIEALAGPRMRQIVEGCYRAHVAIVSVDCYRIYHVEPEVRRRIDAYSHWWHFDQRPVDICKLFINLTPVTPEDGPFTIATIETSCRLLRSAAFRGRSDADFELADRHRREGGTARLLGPPGSAMLCNTQLCLHRAGVPAPGRHRDLLQLVFAASPQPLPERWLAATDPIFGKRSRYHRPSQDARPIG
jgi:hypothetical protein